MLYKPFHLLKGLLLYILLFTYEYSYSQFTYAYGTYIGTGIATSVSGIGFEPDAIMIKSEEAYEAIFATSDMPAGYAKKMATSSTALVTGYITSLNSDGFSLGTENETNKDGDIIHWMAFKSEGDINIGTYTGNNHSGKNITAPGFNPEMTWICGDQAHITADMIICLSSNADDCDYLYDGTKNTNKIHRDGSGFDTDGVSGQSPDKGSTNYYYMCFNNSGSSNLKAGGWNNGSSVDDKHITGPGFQPDFVFVTTYVDGAGAPMFRPGSLTGDASFSFTAQAVLNNSIQSFSTSGFKVGTRNRVQDPWNAHDYAAMNGGTNPIVTLPVELTNFDIKIEDDNKVRIEWTTKSEINNNYFSLERSLDGVNFKVIEKIDGVGNSVEETNYLTYDLNPPVGNVYYRIMQTDFDGTNKYFSIKSVFVGKESEVSWHHMKMENGENTISIQGKLNKSYHIELLDINGSLIYSQKHILANKNASILKCDLPNNLNNGIYLIRIDSDLYQSSGKIIIR